MYLIRHPINPYPQNITIYPHNSYFSFIFAGDRLGSYQIKVYTYSPSPDQQETLVYSSDIVNIPNYIFNNDTVYTNIDIGNILGGNSASYTWEVIMSPFYDLGEATSAQQFNFTSLRYFFQTAPRPYINPTFNDSLTKGLMINGTQYEYDNSNTPSIVINNLENRKIQIEGFYGGADIKYYYFQLFDENHFLIEETNKIFSSKIEYSFTGLLSPRTYQLYLNTVSQQDQGLSIRLDITNTYIPKSNINFPPIITCDPEEANVKIKWAKDSTAVGRATGDYTIDETAGEVEIQSGTIIYDNISAMPIVMDKNNFALGVRTTVNINTTKVFDYINNDILYEVYINNYEFYLRYGEVGSNTYTSIKCGSVKNELVFGIQNYEAPDPNKGYVWYDGDYTVTNDEESFLIVNSVDEKDKFNILLQNINGAVSCTVEKIN